jgi:hypothetical protein
MTKSRYLMLSAPIIVLLALPGLGCGSDQAACSGTVCACNEGGIRFAIEQGEDPYTFECEGLTTVTTGDVIVIDQDVVLDGGGNLVLDGNRNHRVFQILEGVRAELRGFQVTRGSDPGGAAGGILNQGTLILEDSIISANTQGAFRNAGTATVSNCTISDNPDRGIINVFGARMTMTDTTVTENMSGNFAQGGGIWSDGTLVAIGTTVSRNMALSTEGEEPGEVKPGEGGGIYNSGGLTLVNSTVSGNTGEASGGGIHTDDSTDGVTLINTTVADNSSADGSAVWSDAGQPVRFTNTILQGNCGGPGEYISDGHNVETDGDTCGLSQSTDQVDVSTQALGLGRLEDNGGPTETHALGAGSVAVDEIPTSDCLDAEGNPLTVDQRGEPRPSGTMCDVGAFEL